MKIKQIRSWTEFIKLSEEIMKHPEKYGKEIRISDGTIGGMVVGVQKEMKDKQ